MWLINVETYTLENITNPQEESYAILSHTWEDGEVSFQQFQNIDEAKKLKGFQKIDRTVQLARKKGLKYAWVDTCCIDKSSSAELSEAINSMFNWYSDAACCFVFLSDLASVEISPLITLANSLNKRWERLQLGDVQNSIALIFRQCRWFSRGWTLQELVAPNFIEFYSIGWSLIGTKETLLSPINLATQIPTKVLRKDVPLRKIPIAQRMSWAADRYTTRVEDIAYCLLGLFDINLGPLYGEGKHSFIRLQEEILRRSDDMTLFAWQAKDNDQQYRGILAHSPSEFRGSGSIIQHRRSNEMGEFRMTNKGLCLDRSNLIHLNHNTAVLSLNCVRFWGTGGSNVGIRLMNTQHGFVRFLPHKLVDLSEFPELIPEIETPIFIAKTVHSEDSAEMVRLSAGLRIEYEEVANLCVRPDTFYNPIEQKGLFYTHRPIRSFILECFDHSGQHEKFMIVLDTAGTLLGLWLRCLYNAVHEGSCFGRQQDEDDELLIKTNRFGSLPFKIYCEKGSSCCHHVYERCGKDSTAEVCLAGALFSCAIKMTVGSEFESCALAIKITKRNAK